MTEKNMVHFCERGIRGGKKLITTAMSLASGTIHIYYLGYSFAGTRYLSSKDGYIAYLDQNNLVSLL